MDRMLSKVYISTRSNLHSPLAVMVNSDLETERDDETNPRARLAEHVRHPG